MIELIDLRKGFNGQEVLKGVNLLVEKGKTTVVLGRSGCGKSVLLKLILRLLEPDDGRIIINGIDTTEFTDSELAPIRRKIGMLFQGSALFDSMTVWENVAYPLLENSKISFEEINERVRELLEFVELPNSAEKLPGELSGGMKKRVALARALVAKPEFIFYDEPTTGLDPTTASKINALIRRTQEKYGTTSVVVTHDLVSAFSVGDEFVFLNEGIVAFKGDLHSLLSSNITALNEFLKDAAPKNFLENLSSLTRYKE